MCSLTHFPPVFGYVYVGLLLLALLLPISLGDGVLSIISTALFRLLCADESALVIVSRG